MQKRLPSLDQEGVSADQESSLLKLVLRQGQPGFISQVRARSVSEANRIQLYHRADLIEFVGKYFNLLGHAGGLMSHRRRQEKHLPTKPH